MIGLASQSAQSPIQLPDYPIIQLPDPAMTLTFRDLTTLEEFAEVVELERQIWGPGYVEVVPVPVSYTHLTLPTSDLV